MTREEALRFLGLRDEATDEEVKIAYREMSQILHPDRFNGNEKLRDRATEQFKQLNDARDTLLKKGSSAGSSSSSGASRKRASYDTREAQLNARIIGIQAARENLVAIQDSEEDSRRNGLIMFVAGLLFILAARRFVWADAIGGALAVWGIIKTINAWMTIRSIGEKLDELQKEKDACIAELERL